MHAAWVDEMLAAIDPHYVFENLDRATFETLLVTIADVHDEVVEDVIDLPAALEIIIHLENSAAEEFYLHFPPEVPGLPESYVNRMARSCLDHVRMVSSFRDACIRTGRGGVHQPGSGDK